MAALIAAVGLLGCATAPIAPPEEGSCASFSGRGAFVLWLRPLDVQPGDTVPLRVLWRDELGGFTEIPQRCVARWSIADARVGALSVDGTSILVRDDAPSGATTAVSARIGASSVTGELHVYRREDQPLVGLWRQTEDDCGDDTPIVELVFSADGRYAVTWIPFETYTDYWGRWRYDAQTGALELSVDAGNYMPGDVRSGRIALSGDAFDLGDASFGSPREGQRCTAPFHRAH
jgi:hypothetical protein